jgi:hypothetical protein
VLAGQGVHNAWPVDGLYVPAGHAMQAAEDWPAVDGLKVPSGHGRQAAEELLPVEGL